MNEPTTLDKGNDPENIDWEQAVKEFQTTWERAAQGDKTVLPKLREYLKKPSIVDVMGGDLARMAQLALISKVGGNNLVVQESLTRKLELMRADLEGPNPSPLEKLLADRIGACWLHLHHLEIVFASRDDLSIELGNYYQRSIDRAQKRYLAAIKTLAIIRKLALPVLQVNIARKQVNVAGSPDLCGMVYKK